MVLTDFRCLQSVDNKSGTLKQVNLNTDPDASGENIFLSFWAFVCGIYGILKTEVMCVWLYVI